MFGDKKRKWLLVADKAKARVYEWLEDNKVLNELSSFKDDDARKPERALKAERPGHGNRDGIDTRYAIDEKVSYKQQASDLLLEAVADHIGDPSRISDFDELIIIAQHDVYKTLVDNLNTTAKDKLILHYPKNLTNMPVADLLDYCAKNLNIRQHKL